MRLIGKSGERVTLGGSPGSDGLVDETRLKSILDHLAERGATNLHGVVSIEGILLTNNYDRIASDPNVYLVDVSGTFARNEINQDSSLRGQSQRFVVPPAFWYLEDLGLAK